MGSSLPLRCTKQGSLEGNVWVDRNLGVDIQFSEEQGTVPVRGIKRGHTAKRWSQQPMRPAGCHAPMQPTLGTALVPPADQNPGAQSWHGAPPKPGAHTVHNRTAV